MKTLAFVVGIVVLGAVGIVAQDPPSFQGQSANDWADRLAGETTRRTADAELFAHVPDVAPILPVLIRDGRVGVRETGIVLAGRCGPAAAGCVPELRKLLVDANQHVRSRAAWALGEIGPASAPTASDIVKLLGGDESERYTAATALWEIGPAGRDELVKAFRAGPDERLVQAFGRGGEKAAPALVAFLDEPDPRLSQAAVDALVLVGWTAIPALEEKGHSRLVEKILAGSWRRYFEQKPDGMALVVGPEPEVDPDSVAIEWETNCEYRGAFAVYRFRFEGGVMRADRVRHPGMRSVKDRREAPVTAASAVMNAPRARALIRALLATTRLSMDRVREGHGVKTFWCSTAHFYGRLHLARNGRDLYDSEYMNRAGKKYSNTYVRLIVAEGILKDAVKGIEWTERPVSEADLEQLQRRTRSITAEDWTAWEGVLLLVRAVGDPRFLPWLQEIIVRTERKKVEYLAFAIDAYARIAGVDYRTDPFTWKEAPAVRERYLHYFAGQKKAGKDR